MLGGGLVKESYELKGGGRSIRGIARKLGVSRNTVHKYVRSRGMYRQGQSASENEAGTGYREYIDGRLAEGLEDCVVLLRESRELGYEGRLHHAEGLCASSPAAQAAEGDGAVRDEAR